MINIFLIKKVSIIILIGFALYIGGGNLPAYADAAPPAQPPGANPEPGNEITEVRMVAETVIIDVMENTPKGSLGQAKVTANFTMRNLGSQAESMAARFPMGASDGYSNLVKISDMQIKVNGSIVNTWQIEGEDPWGYLDEVPWMAFNVTFPPDQDVMIQVSYTLEASGELPFISYDYVFSTGAAWKGTIGSATLYVRFPYEVSDLNVLPFTSGESIAKHQLSARELKWVFDEFEPTIADNFRITLVAPSIWQQVIKERVEVNKHPDDGEAWGRLAKLYKELAFSSRQRGFRYNDFSSDPGARSLFAMSVASYEKAIERKWYDPLWHAGYADLLGYYAYYAGFEGIDTRPEAEKALQHINIALDINPKDDKVRTIADLLVWYLDGQIKKDGYGYVFPGLTQTPIFHTLPPDTIPSAATATLIEIPTATPASETIPTEEPTQTPSPVISICGSVLFFPLGLVFLYRIKRR